MLFGVQCVTNPRYRILNLFFPFSDRQASESKRQSEREKEREGKNIRCSGWPIQSTNGFVTYSMKASKRSQKTLKEEEARKSFHFLESQKEYVYFLPLPFLFLSFFFCHARVDRKIYLRWISLSGKSTLLFALAATTASIKNNNNFPLTPYNYKTKNIIYI